MKIQFFILLIALRMAESEAFESSNDEETLLGKILCGYQGWFTAKGDGSNNEWTHYKMHSSRQFAKDNCVIDFWPDTDSYPTKYPVPEFGSNQFLFSSNDYSTVRTHFDWMQQYGIDGIFLQRFGSDIRSKQSSIYKFKNNVFSHVQSAARQTNRLWALMYDLSGLNVGEIKSVIMDDWAYLNRQYKFREDTNYIRHKGKPLIAIWGVGFNDNRKYTLTECKQLIQFLKSGSFGGNSIMLGVPRAWKDGGSDAVVGTDLELLHQIILSSDVVSPWSVGRYNTIQTARIYARVYLKEDLAWCNKNGVSFLPVIFPGFSWHNLQVSGENPEHPGPYNQIPRKQGNEYFLKVQGEQDIKAGAKMLYVAMFDEMNEGTAIFKCSTKPPILGDGLKFVPIEESSDFYLRLTGQLGKLLKQSYISSRSSIV